MTPIRGLDPCGCWVDPIRYEYVGAVRPYFDRPDIVIPVRWYFAPPLANPLPYQTAFGDSFYINTPNFTPEVGMDRAFNASFVGNPRGYAGVRPCGNAGAWSNGVSYNNPPDFCNCVREAVIPIQEIPTGDIDGVNRTFLTSEVPMSASSLLVMLNGVLQLQGTNYSVSSATIYFTASSTPPAGSNLFVYYWVQN